MVRVLCLEILFDGVMRTSPSHFKVGYSNISIFFVCFITQKQVKLNKFQNDFVFQQLQSNQNVHTTFYIICIYTNTQITVHTHIQYRATTKSFYKTLPHLLTKFILLQELMPSDTNKCTGLRSLDYVFPRFIYFWKQ